jgi:hypothetical protein
MEAAILDDVVECSTLSSFWYSRCQDKIYRTPIKKDRYFKFKYLLNAIRWNNKCSCYLLVTVYILCIISILALCVFIVTCKSQFSIVSCARIR